MAIEFVKSPRPTLGVELEIQLIDQQTKALVPSAIALLEDASHIPKLRLVSELNQSMVEINTEICNTVKEVALSLERQMQLLRQISEKKGIDIAISGNHPFHNWKNLKIYPNARYFKILEKFQWLARRLTTFGLHVHIGVRNGDRAISIMNSLIHFIPHLLALSASSPFWGSQDTGLASCRAAVFESFPTEGLPYFMIDWKEFQDCYETLIIMEAIQSIKDIYWDIRPHFDFGTVEIRVCDGLPTLKETLALVALIQCLVVWLDDQYQKGTRSRQIHMQRYWVAPENKWQAARYGLEGIIIDPINYERCHLREEIGKLLESLAPVALSLDCVEELSFIREILRKGPSTTRQRKLYYQTHSFQNIVESLIRELKENNPFSENKHSEP